MMIEFIFATILIPLAALITGFLIPGLERKIQARIQQRIGPPILTPGFWAILKFFYKEKIKPNSPMPRLFHSLPIIGVFVMFFAVLFTTPKWWNVNALGTVVAVVGLLKVIEFLFMAIGSFSRSILSVSMPYADQIKGAVMKGDYRRFFEQQSVLRAFKMITVGSFPLYIAMFVPVILVKSINFSDIVQFQGFDSSFIFPGGIIDLMYLEKILSLKPILFTFPGLIAGFVYFIGYIMVLNEYPFSIEKAKSDVIEGPSLEYASWARGGYYLMRESILFALSSVFITLFIGLPPTLNLTLLVVHCLLCLIMPILFSIVSAFSPIFTFKQVYPVSMGFTALGFLAMVVSLVMGVV
ncbi:MAG TPA: NADH-quinone oxidoreductase subunit H [Methanofastidiosum sp.]|nr:NADH-quinone oxidoreductase subunit H [Methanofastidiosum sp.]HPA49007.1 NADH-quinone oxidoreductase subunit H [Methanofastidiosum sp.]HQK62393.1 NADH-quinone oxidoreductase subunit H [Methanofastidiosum sp.]HQM94985.1 NADH-quinone oxidoreductase subunit H [Methanofastidiosum sp.]HQQ48352.1 NADH-quinone oxidoreductase subunit H [Methanofastidiosum sp.]